MVGERLILSPDIEAEVVGVVEAVHHWGQHQEPDPQIYVVYPEWAVYFARFHVGVRVAPGLSLADDLRQAIWAVDPDGSVDEVITMRQRVADAVAEPRFYSALLVSFAAVSVLLAAGGIYGSLLYSVGQRRRELGVRMALGARGADVVRMVLREGMAHAAIGIAIGAAGALAMGRVLQSLVFGITTTDPLTYAVVAAILAAGVAGGLCRPGSARGPQRPAGEPA